MTCETPRTTANVVDWVIDLTDILDQRDRDYCTAARRSI
jgi:hypothetical protein